MRDSRGTGARLRGADEVEARLADSRLTRGQKEAVRTVLLSKDIVVGVQGYAGSGKTTMLREVKALLGEGRIQGLAPSAAAARVLGRAAGIASTTLQWFLTRYGDLSDPEQLEKAYARYAGTVLAVDECSMIDTVRMRELLHIARRLGVARVALVGDTEQLRAVDAGQPFRLLQKAGMRTATMDEVLRQEDDELREAVMRARHGEPGASIRGLRGDRVREVPREELGAEAARCWLALAPEERADTAVMAPTHEIRRRTNEAIRAGLEEEGTLHGGVLKVDRLVNRHLTRAEAADIVSYEPGDTVVFHRDAYGWRTNDVCTVMGKRDGRVILLHPDGGERGFRPAGNAKNYLGLFDTERIELRAGERIRWTRNRKAPKPRSGRPPLPGLVNGGEAEIVEIDRKRVRFRDGDQAFSLALGDPQLRHLDHAYCTTVHAAQGKTARAAIAVLDAGGAADQQMFHVEISRVRREFLLLTDDREALIELLEGRSGGEEGALEALGIDPAALPSEDAEILAELDRDWRALERQAAETNTVAFFLPGYRDAMARAAALAAVGDLPPELGRLVDRMMAEHRRHLARDRAVRELVAGIQEHGRRWPELGWAAEAQGVDEIAGHAAWRENAAALAEAGRRRLAAQGEERRHLEAMPGVPGSEAGAGGLADVLAELERTRLLDDTRRFERLWQSHRESAVGSGPPELLAEGYAEVAALGEKLAGADGLDPRGRDAVAQWRDVHAAQTAMADAVRGLPDRVAAWRAAPARGAGDPGEPARGGLAGGGDGPHGPGEWDAAPRRRAWPVSRCNAGHAGGRPTGCGGNPGRPRPRSARSVCAADGSHRPAVGGDRDRAVLPAPLRRDDRRGASILGTGEVVGGRSGGCGLMDAIPREGHGAPPGHPWLAREGPGTAGRPAPARCGAGGSVGLAGERGAAARRRPRDADGERPPRTPPGGHAPGKRGAGRGGPQARRGGGGGRVSGDGRAHAGRARVRAANRRDGLRRADP